MAPDIYSGPDRRMPAKENTVHIDPVEYGRLLSKVEKLEEEMAALRTDVHSLLEVVNRSKGALWLGMTLAASFGALFSWVAQHFQRGGPP